MRVTFSTTAAADSSRRILRSALADEDPEVLFLEFDADIVVNGASGTRGFNFDAGGKHIKSNSYSGPGGTKIMIKSSSADKAVTVELDSHKLVKTPVLKAFNFKKKSQKRRLPTASTTKKIHITAHLHRNRPLLPSNAKVQQLSEKNEILSESSLYDALRLSSGKGRHCWYVGDVSGVDISDGISNSKSLFSGVVAADSCGESGGVEATLIAVFDNGREANSVISEESSKRKLLLKESEQEEEELIKKVRERVDAASSLTSSPISKQELQDLKIRILGEEVKKQREQKSHSNSNVQQTTSTNLPASESDSLGSRLRIFQLSSQMYANKFHSNPLLNSDSADKSTVHHQFTEQVSPALLERVADVRKFLSPKLRSSSSSRRKLVGNAQKYVEVAVVHDKSRADAYGATGANSGTQLAQMYADTVTIMNGVHAMYRGEINRQGSGFDKDINIVLVSQTVFSTGDEYAGRLTRSSAACLASYPNRDHDTSNGESICETEEGKLLDEFNKWAIKSQDGGILPSNDNHVLLSGRDFFNTTVGLAYVDTMCIKDGSVGSRTVYQSGNINMCSYQLTDFSLSNQWDCSAVVAHEMGHNFGMEHDGDTSTYNWNTCHPSGYVMEAVGVASATAMTNFSSCSGQFINDYFGVDTSATYGTNGQCLENSPLTVWGSSAVCGNGLVEAGEDCDCGSSDCSSTDHCCNGATCSFAFANYTCSAYNSPCCDSVSCTIRTAEERHVCRDPKDSSGCDFPEYCNGTSADCPADRFFHAGRNCSIVSEITDSWTHSLVNRSFAGVCALGYCKSLEQYCSVEINRDFPFAYTQWGLTEDCQRYNDDCQVLTCTNVTKINSNGDISQIRAGADSCERLFYVDSPSYAWINVPDGMPCWHRSGAMGGLSRTPSDSYNLDDNSGMCLSGACILKENWSRLPSCGNGLIDYGETCDCGGGE